MIHVILKLCYNALWEIPSLRTDYKICLFWDHVNERWGTKCISKCVDIVNIKYVQGLIDVLNKSKFKKWFVEPCLAQCDILKKTNDKQCLLLRVYSCHVIPLLTNHSS